MTTFTILDQATCASKIARIARVGKIFQREVHMVAVSTLAHIRDHGDPRLALRLIEAMPNGQRVKALAYWYGHFSGHGVSFAFDKANGWTAKMAKKWSAETFDVEGAYETSFADLTAEKGYSTMTVQQLVTMLQRKADEDGLHPNGAPKVEPAARELALNLFLEAKKQLGVGLKA